MWSMACGISMTMERWDRSTTWWTRETQVRKPPASNDQLIMSFVAQGIISDIVGTLFQIEHDYFGTMLSNLAKVSALRLGG